MNIPQVEPGLSFTAVVGGRVSLWAPDRSGSYGEANARGRRYAEEMLAHIRATQNPVWFGFIIREIAQSTVYGPVEIGFCHRLGVELLGVGIVPVEGQDPPDGE